MSQNTTIKCPECGNKIDVNDILKHQIEDTLKADFLKEKNELQKAHQDKAAALDKARQDFDESKKRDAELYQERLDKARKETEKELEKKIGARMKDDNDASMKAMQAELAEKSEKVKDLIKKEAEIERLKRENEEAKETAKLEAQRELTKLLAQEREKIQRQADERNELKFKEMQKQLDDQKKLTEEMKRKQEQGSMQLQGEVMELAIEEWLAAQFPLDTITEIKKGANGADCILTVNTREQANCGSIYFESKRTKTFQPAWIEKFKNDIRQQGAGIGVLVTAAMPADMDRMGLRDGIWICTFEEFKALSAVLRHTIIRLGQLKQGQENKGDKMSILYDFLTGPEFRLQMEGIVEGFTQMQIDLQKEKTAMKNMWKKREKQIEKVIDNAVTMHGSIRGIAGSAVKSIPALELDAVEEQDIPQLN